MNEKLREEVHDTLHRIDSHYRASPPQCLQASHSAVFKFDASSRTSSTSSVERHVDQVIVAPQKIINALRNTTYTTNNDDRVTPVRADRMRSSEDSQSTSSSPSDPHLHRCQTSGSDYDRFIQENLNHFVLNDECSSSELGHANGHSDHSQRRHVHDRDRGESDRGEEEEEEEEGVAEDDHDDMELQLKNCDADLSQFPTEKECYPTYCDPDLV
mmetsp:Transcript_19458/g.30891  ORF Transcript_19458/g.30891 Transcript_19458/m.30891 type:complete len:214 (+) Transcript_19458:673-1314(+)